MIRLLFLTHRYLGIAMGLVITLWCLSGFVMMYVQYPDLNDQEQLTGLEILNFSTCCQIPNDFSNLEFDRFRIEMLNERPVLRLLNGPYQYVIDLLNGEYLPGFYDDDARSIANIVAKEFELPDQPELLGLIEQDQWTVFPAYQAHRPLFHFSINDLLGTEFYISSTTGEVVQMTTSGERFWNRIGAVVHWLYPTILRQNAYIWLQTVIWLTLISLFLTAIGIYIGLHQYKIRRNGRKSPYRGWVLWHHYAGLIFGLFTLAWLVSGLFSVNPWGALEGRDFLLEKQHLQGATLDFEKISEFVASHHWGEITENQISGSTVRLEGVMVGGRIALIASSADGGRTRLNANSLRTEILPDTHFTNAGAMLRPQALVRSSDWIIGDDAYYFSHHQTRRFPVYRIQYEDGERFYLDNVSGELTFAVDRDRRWLRWIFHALHRGDFSRLLRSRPIWDLFMLPLMLGVTVGAITGTWIGIRRLVRAIKYPAKYPLNQLPEFDPASVKSAALSPHNPG